MSSGPQADPVRSHPCFRGVGAGSRRGRSPWLQQSCGRAGSSDFPAPWPVCWQPHGWDGGESGQVMRLDR